MLTDERERQIALCQVPSLSYTAAHADAVHKLRKGQLQAFCETCRRWKWGDELCKYARYTGQPQIQREWFKNQDR